MLELAT